MGQNVNLENMSAGCLGETPESNRDPQLGTGNPQMLGLTMAPEGDQDGDEVLPNSIPELEETERSEQLFDGFPQR